MGRIVDVIRCHIVEKYMASYMRERNVDALLVLRNETKWAMTGNFLKFFVLTIFVLIFSFLLLFFSVVFMWYFLFSR